ncbi:3-dehydroquinate synthase II [Candidatus Hecatella orcuttiae]|jgi:3-dehydroquinate synthase II|uniref:3-dehydroquinate synthase II n=1 Tax=Candidatus Hecatella orcuttiae TaxID=1935119 RepID=UPI002867CE2D|nr:3-dehydroquinate synthase II [Candidatus Hecatella orcuttiae]
MKEFWIEIDPSLPEETKRSLLAAAQGLCTTALVEGKLTSLAESLGLKTVSSEGGEIQLLGKLSEAEVKKAKEKGKGICVKMNVRGRADEDKIVEAASLGVDCIIASCPDWKVIPLENLIAKIQGRSKLLAEVSSGREAKLALETLELGVDGVVLKAKEPGEIVEVASALEKVKAGREEPSKLRLVPAKVVGCKELGLGARVCIDTCDLMTHGEGILVGCQSSGLFLVQAEVQENPHVEPRPFRVNAGPVSLYTLTPEGKTKYLSELKAGEEVAVVDRGGNLRAAFVGRVKIEKRPMLLVEAEVEGRRVKTIVQNAETIRLVTKEGSKSVRDLKPGDEVLIHHQPGGRHFGILLKEETVIEL